MSSYLDSIPQAVASIVCSFNLGQITNKGEREAVEKWAIDLTDQLTRTFAKALREAEAEGKK